MTGFLYARIKNIRSIRPVNKTTGMVTTMNELLVKDTSGEVKPATSASVHADLVGICNQTIAAADALLTVPVIEIFPNDTFVVDSTNNSDVTHNGQWMVLTDSTHVNNTGTTSATGIVEQVGTLGATTDKKIIVKFVF